MNQISCRTTLARLIGEENSALGELVQLLEAEYEHLNANNVAALQNTMERRQNCVARILRVDEQRQRLCQSCGQPHDPAGLERVMLWCDPEGTLTDKWQHCAQVATRARQLNDRNGSLVGARLKHVQDRLGTLLDNRGDELACYDRRGLRRALNSGRIVAAEA